MSKDSDATSEKQKFLEEVRERELAILKREEDYDGVGRWQLIGYNARNEPVIRHSTGMRPPAVDSRGKRRKATELDLLEAKSRPNSQIIRDFTLHYTLSPTDTSLDVQEDDEWEPGLTVYRERLISLNHVVERLNSGNAEGGLFYPWHVDPRDTPDPRLRTHRQNFAHFVNAARSMLQVGFNVGHSTLLALTHNGRLTMTVVDWAGHPYSDECFSLMKEWFGKRLELIKMDSREYLPSLMNVQYAIRDFDRIHLHGNTGREFVNSDVTLSLPLLCEKGKILVEDADQPEVRAACLAQVRWGRAKIVYGRPFRDVTSQIILESAF